jgi:hypothetical protein
MNIYIHIGYPKTGTTWFREKFLSKIENIKRYDKQEIKDNFVIPGAFDFNEWETKKKFDLKEGSDIWISAELLTDKLNTGGTNGYLTKEVANRLKIVFPNAIILVFIRNQVDMLASSYNQYVKGGGSYGIKKFLFPERYFGARIDNCGILGPKFYLYDKTIDYYSTLFGKENIHIFLYEEFAENPKKFIELLAVKFNLKISEELIEFSSINKGYSRFLLSTRRFCNKFSRIGTLNKYYLFHIHRWNLINRRVHDYANQFRIFGKKPESKQIIGNKNLGIIRNYYKDSNQILIDKYDLKQIAKYNYPL